MGVQVALAMQCAKDGSGEYVVPQTYVRFLEHAGAQVVPVSPETPIAEFIRIMSRCQGLVVPGGNDIEPWRYRQEPQAGLDKPVPTRDTFELSAVRYCILENIPYLGICRGAQVLNVALGGTLIQRLAPSSVNHWPEGPRNTLAHEVRVAEDGLLAQAIGQQVIVTNSLHHQAIGEVGDCLTVVAQAPDGVVEAVELAEVDFCLGVQWHPEELVGTPHSDALGARFVSACQARIRQMAS